MNKRRLAVIAVICIFIAIYAVGSVAFFTDQTKQTNVITAGGIDIELKETAVPPDGGDPVPFENVSNITPGAEVSKIVEVKNVGPNDAYVRISVEKAIELREGVEADVDLGLVKLDINENAWTEQDGYYYYNKPLAAGDTTEPLFTLVTFDMDMGNEYQGSTATVNIVAQATQVANNGASALEAQGWPAADKEA